MKCVSILILFVSPLLTFALSPGFTMPVRRSFEPKVSISCKTIHCPVTEKPICVKFKHKKAEVSTKEYYIYMINKCELQYIKCHQGDVEATVVPMKNCIHGKSSSPRGPGGPVKKRPKRHVGIGDLSLVNHVRRKRNAGKLDNKAATNKTSVNKAITTVQATPALKAQKTEGTKSNQTKVLNVNNTVVSRRHGDIYEKDKKYYNQPFFVKGSDKSGSSESSKSSANSNEKNRNERGKSSSRSSESAKSSDSEFDQLNAIAGDQNNSLDSESEEELKGTASKKRSAKQKEADKDCPTECPARGVMVCAQCQHGVYRTFISVCHMRMFVCNNQDEKLHLVSRYPCVLSAPFLPSNKGRDEQPRGHVTEPHDHDEVLRFIYCREADEFGSKKIVDPRCSHFKSYINIEREKLVGKSYLDLQDS